MVQTKQKQYIAVRYAQAFLNLYGSKLTPDMYDAFCALKRDIEAQKKVLFFFGLSMISDDVKRNAIDRLSAPYACGPHFKRLLIVLLESQRMHLLPSILEAIITGYRRLHNYQLGEVASSHPLTQEQQEEIHRLFEKRVGKKLVLTYTVLPHLIAGFKIVTEDHMWEYSIDKQLRDMEQSLPRKGHA